MLKASSFLDAFVFILNRIGKEKFLMENRDRTLLSIISFIVSIIALLISWIPVVTNIDAILALLAIILSIIAIITNSKQQ